MKKTKIIVVILSLVLCMVALSVPAFAMGVPHPPDDSESTSDDTDTSSGQYFPYFPVPIPMPTPPDESPSEEPPTISPSNPFTPPGTGTVVDAATDGDGKEFFTIMTEDGNVFFLIIDHQRSVNNVYFLSTVTEEDLLSLAQQGGRPGSGNSDIISARPPIEPPEPGVQDPPEAPAEPEPEQPTRGNGRLIPVLVAVVGAGGAAYYFKIIKGKKDDPDDEPQDDESNEYDNEDEDEFGDELEDEERD